MAAPKACALCGKRFGLVRQYHRRTQFCSATCKDAYLRDEDDQANKQKFWQDLLRLPTNQRLFKSVSPNGRASLPKN